jgi:hypothetical protein
VAQSILNGLDRHPGGGEEIRQGQGFPVRCRSDLETVPRFQGGGRCRQRVQRFDVRYYAGKEENHGRWTDLECGEDRRFLILISPT